MASRPAGWQVGSLSVGGALRLQLLAAHSTAAAWRADVCNADGIDGASDVVTQLFGARQHGSISVTLSCARRGAHTALQDVCSIGVPCPSSRCRAAGWSRACVPCKAQRWERRLGGLLEGDGGGMKGWLQSQNHAAGCGGQDGARCGLVERRSWGAAPPPSSQRATLLSPVIF